MSKSLHEFRNGQGWTFVADSSKGNPEPNQEDEPDGFVVFSENPSPETGCVGWVWWEHGDMGDAKTLEQARAAVELSLEKAEELARRSRE